MSLNLSKLEKVRELADGSVQARCPACAEGGKDRKGEHLRVYADGRYGCCVHPKDGEHRKRIYALVGDRTPRRFTVKVATAVKPAEPARSVMSALVGAVRTLRTAISESVQSENPATTLPEGGNSDFRTLRTPFSNPRAHRREEVSCDTHICKDSEKGVLSVLTEPKRQKLPFLTPGGTLVIPFDSPERYHWWKPPHDQRLRVKETLAEVLARKEEVENGAAF